MTVRECSQASSAPVQCGGSAADRDFPRRWTTQPDGITTRQLLPGRAHCKEEDS